MRRYRLQGRILPTVLIPIAVVATLVIGGAGGYALKTWHGGGETGGPLAPGQAPQGAEEVWYTCGMHPQVLEKEPGDCPICHMKLTPLKQDKGAAVGPKTGPAERKILYWRAPMDPGYVSDKPGKSPMGMDLVPVYADGAGLAAGAVTIDPVTIQNMGLRTTRVRRAPLVKTIRTLGRLDYDERLVVFVNTKFDGYIEELYVDYTGQEVKKGQPLFDVYSPELVVAQEELVQAVRYLPQMGKSTYPDAVRNARQNVESARVKLRYYDITDERIDELAKTGKITKVMTVHSPATGVVTEKMALQGMYVKPGMQLYTIADLSRIWVYVDVYEYQLPWIKVGQKASMSLPYIPGKVFHGEVVYIYPYLQRATRVVKVRLEFDNPTLALKPDMYANVRIDAKLKADALLVPREAYLDSGVRKVVFVDRGGGKFDPRELITGVEAENDMVEVLHGLDEGEVVVTSGQFLLDAESKLREAVAKMMEARRVATKKKAGQSTAGMTEHDRAGHERPTSAPTTAPSALPAGAKYACPMSTHPDAETPAERGAYFSAEPGKCPVCGMKLKPIDALKWTAKYHPGQPVTTHPAGADAGNVVPKDARFACPMSTHPDAETPAERGAYFSAEPGKCPVCGMKLKPIEDLKWAQALRASAGADVAYTCPDHQHVFSEQPGECPRCGRELEPFRVAYTCRDPQHAGQISMRADACPECDQAMVPFRGPWLSEAMATGNVPPTTQPAGSAPYRCPTHPLVHSDGPGRCTICAAELTPTGAIAAAATKPSMPTTPRAAGAGKARFTCPMHPQVHQQTHGICPICAMQLVPVASLIEPTTVPARVRRQMDFITEHYLALQRLLASDSTKAVARNALGIAAAAQQIIEHLDDTEWKLPQAAIRAVRAIRASALAIAGVNIDRDRVRFGELSSAFIALVDECRPNAQRWPSLYVFRCPMAKADWVQSTEAIANPYYGFKMRDCGELKAKK